MPTLFFPDGQRLFGPVLIDPPTGDAAVRLWDAVTGLARVPAPLRAAATQEPPPTSERIAETFRPYLEARDWVSINRGEVVGIPSVD